MAVVSHTRNLAFCFCNCPISDSLVDEVSAPEEMSVRAMGNNQLIENEIYLMNTFPLRTNTSAAVDRSLR